MQAVLTEIISLLVGGIQGIASGVGSGLSTLATSVFLTESEGTQKLSAFGGIIVVFAGISLAIGLCRLVVQWISSLGGHRM